jgi:hypothetical protein
MQVRLPPTYLPFLIYLPIKKYFKIISHDNDFNLGINSTNQMVHCLLIYFHSLLWHLSNINDLFYIT